MYVFNEGTTAMDMKHNTCLREAKMKTNPEKRSCRRHSYTVPIVFSYFNNEHFIEAQTLNHSADGMCFKSSFSVNPGATLYIRVIKFYSNGSFNGGCGMLRSVTLAEVKWCCEILNLNEPFYQIGVKYHRLEY